MITSDVENFPGFPEGVLGPDLMVRFREQAERFGTEFITDDVTSVDFSERPFRVSVGSTEHRARAVIVATGASARQLGLPSEQALQARGVSYCATCDAAFFPDKKVIVVGGGDSALEEATYLTKFAKDVVLVHRRDELRGSKIMQDYAKAKPNLSVLTPYVVDEVLGADVGHVTGARLRNAVTGEERVEESDGFFVAIGHTPNTALFRGILEMDEAGYLTSSRARRARRSRASSPPATSPITSTARPSRRPGPAARPRSTPSAGSRTAPVRVPCRMSVCGWGGWSEQDGGSQIRLERRSQRVPNPRLTVRP